MTSTQRNPMSSRLLLALCLFPYSLSASPTPNTDQLDLTLTLLTDNDLYGPETTRTTRAILIESTQSWNTAPSACNLVSESVWSPETEDFASGLNNTLSYQKYLNKYPSSQRFWVKKGAGCVAIDFNGNTQQEDCHKRLPVLCTNSAPFSNLKNSDKSAPWQVSRKFGNQVITGYRDKNSFRFLGVRYAADPGRFVHSEVYAGNGAVSAFDYHTECIQGAGLASPVGVEDCLFLNLWTPYLPGKAANLKNLKPVMIWLHGGGLVAGSPNDPGTDGGDLASRGDVVIIGIAYRLGNFGWQAINEDAKGNYGLGDMITALKWIKANVKAFGGDPSKVTLMGESGGAAGVRGVLASKKSKGLVSGGIFESGPWGLGLQKVYSDFYTSEYSASTVGVQVAEEVGCGAASDILACLKEVDAGALASTVTYAGYPLIDGDFLTSSYGVAGEGYAADVPILIGIVRDEIAILLKSVYGLANATLIAQLVGPGAFNQDMTRFVGDPAFPPPTGLNPVDTAFRLVTRIGTDYAFTCLSWAMAYSMAKYKVVPAVYAFSFNRTYQPLTFDAPFCNPPKTAEHPLGDFDAEYLKCHAGEVTPIFGGLKYMEYPDRDGLDVPFFQFALDTWASFVRTGNPNIDVGYLEARGYWGTVGRVSGSDKWEKVNHKNPKVRVLQLESHSIDFTEGPQCNALGLPLSYYEDL